MTGITETERGAHVSYLRHHGLAATAPLEAVSHDYLCVIHAIVGPLDNEQLNALYRVVHEMLTDPKGVE